MSLDPSSIEHISSESFLTEVMDPLLNALTSLIQTEETTEISYLNSMRDRLSTLLPNNSPAKAMLDNALNKETLNLSVAFNLLSELESNERLDVTNFANFIHEKKIENQLYSAKEWDTIIMSAIDEAWEENLPLNQLGNKVVEIALDRVFVNNPKKNSQVFLAALKDFKARITPDFLDFLGLDQSALNRLMQSLTKNDTPYIIKKLKEKGGTEKYGKMPVNEILHNFAIGKMRGLFSEMRKEGSKSLFVQSGQVKDAGLNIEADKMRLFSFDLNIDQSVAEELEQIKIKSDFDKKVQELFGQASYFRIEYSVKSSSSNAPKIKDASSFAARFEQLRKMGRQLGTETEVNDLIFTIINRTPGFIAESVSLNDLARAVASLGFAFMFDIEEPRLLGDAETLVNNANKEKRIHVYDVNGIYYLASDVLKALRATIEENKGKYLLLTNQTIKYNGLNAETIYTSLKEQHITNPQQRWELVRNTIIGAAPRLGLNYGTFGGWDFNKSSSSSGLRMNFNQLLKAMSTLKVE